MRKLISILLLTCLCLTLLGYHLVYFLQTARAKAEMKAFIKTQKDHKDIIEFSFTHKESEQLYWEDEQEFRFNGEMYDVIEKKTEGARLVIRCIPDKKETALLKTYQKNNRRNRSASFVQLIIAPFILPSEHHLDQPEKTIAKNYLAFSTLLINRADSVPVPPPDGC